MNVSSPVLAAAIGHLRSGRSGSPGSQFVARSLVRSPCIWETFPAPARGNTVGRSKGVLSRRWPGYDRFPGWPFRSPSGPHGLFQPAKSGRTDGGMTEPYQEPREQAAGKPSSKPMGGA
jgi:hypothetical protein